MLSTKNGCRAHPYSRFSVRLLSRLTKPFIPRTHLRWHLKSSCNQTIMTQCSSIEGNLKVRCWVCVLCSHLKRHFSQSTLKSVRVRFLQCYAVSNSKNPLQAYSTALDHPNRVTKIEDHLNFYLLLMTNIQHILCTYFLRIP